MSNLNTLLNRLNECRSALTAIKSPSSAIQTILDALMARLTILETEIQQNPAAPDDQREKWEGQLVALRDAIRQTVPDGPSDAGSEMFKTFASNARIVGISLWAVLGVVAMILLLLVNAKKLIGSGLPQEIVSALPLVAIMGALGGFLTCIQSFGRYVGNREFLRSWTIYYVLFPLKGAGLAIIVFFLGQTGFGQRDLDLGAGREAPLSATNVVSLTEPRTVTLTTNAATGVVVTNVSTNLPVSRLELVTRSGPAQSSSRPNLVLAALIASLTGMFANQAIEMLGGIFSRVFAKVEAKDKITEGQNGTAKAK